MLVRHFNFQQLDSVVKTQSLLPLKAFAIVLLVYLPDNLDVFELQVPEFVPLNKGSSCFFKLIEEIVFQVADAEKEFLLPLSPSRKSRGDSLKFDRLAALVGFLVADRAGEVVADEGGVGTERVDANPLNGFVVVTGQFVQLLEMEAIKDALEVCVWIDELAHSIIGCP